ncbi:peptide MFS transporter [Novosphingobium ovatum]|nr:peptide MFS transporter [Novosphingobium ovatum]
MTETDATPATGQKGWFGHPPALARLFTIEMWERFGYYGMRALLMLYLTKHFVLGDHASAGLYGGYTALVYLTPLVGGLIADQYLGAKRSVRFGALLMAAGYIALAFGGAPSKAWAEYDGVRHEIIVENFRDGPTSAANEARYVLDNGQKLTIKGQADGSIDLISADGAVARSLPQGALKEGSDKDPLHLAILLTALATIAVGNGFFKPNISTMVGALYAPGDSRRDAGFTIFYMGINLGSILGQFLCALLADHIGWWGGFGIAGIGMLVSFALVTFHGGRLNGLGDTPLGQTRDRGVVIYVLALLAIPALYWLFSNLMSAPRPTPGAGIIGMIMALPVLTKVLNLTFLIAIPGILVWAWRAGSRQEFEMMLAAMVLVVFNVLFWTLFEQAGSSLSLFADRNTDRSVFGLFEMSAPQTQNFNPISVVILAPILSALWGALAARGREPSIPVKFGIALIGVGAGFLILVLGAQFADDQFRVGLFWLAALYVVHSAAELCISPVGLSMITKLSIARITGLMMGVWFLSISLAQSLAGLLAQSASVETVGGEVTNPKLSLETYLAIYEKFGLITIGVGVLLLIGARWLRRWMHGVN